MASNLDDKLSAMGEVIAKQVVTAVRQNCTICKGDVDKHEKTLYGNGRLGLTTKVAVCWYGMWVISLVIVGVLVESFARR